MTFLQAVQVAAPGSLQSTRHTLALGMTTEHVYSGLGGMPVLLGIRVWFSLLEEGLLP